MEWGCSILMINVLFLLTSVEKCGFNHAEEQPVQKTFNGRKKQLLTLVSLQLYKEGGAGFNG